MISNSNIIQISQVSPKDICKDISGRVKARRLELNLTQCGLANRAGVNIETYRKFERIGEISLLNLVKLALAMDMSNEFNVLFSQHQFQTLDDLLEQNESTRKRGSKS